MVAVFVRHSSFPHLSAVLGCINADLERKLKEAPVRSERGISFDRSEFRARSDCVSNLTPARSVDGARGARESLLNAVERLAHEVMIHVYNRPEPVARVGLVVLVVVCGRVHEGGEKERPREELAP